MDDFDREVYCLLGLPFDAVDLSTAVDRIRTAAQQKKACFLSTPNVNFLVACQRDAAFRDSVTHSDLSIVDGMPLVWIAKLLGIPIHQRVAGSEVFDALQKTPEESGEALKIYFFGGGEGAAEQACIKLNESSSGVRCVGWQTPGFEPVEAMSGADRITAINSSGADFLVLALGARKGQVWIERNLSRLNVPVVSHLGAVVNFSSGTVRRAPVWLQHAGLEWLWRIKEEPALWKRYWHDGLGLLDLLLTTALPYALSRRFGRSKRQFGQKPYCRLLMQDGCCRIDLGGWLPDALPSEMRDVFRAAAGNAGPVVLDLTEVQGFGPGFIGLILMLKKRMDQEGSSLRIAGVKGHIRRLFRWNRVEYLLSP